MLALLPYELVGFAASSLSEQEKLLLLCWLRVPKLIYVRHLGANAQTVARAVPAHLRPSGGAMRIVKIEVLLIFVNHVAACTWMFIASWLQPHGPDDPSWVRTDLGCNPWAYLSLGTRYMRSLYYSITVLSTVGYGDIKPATPLETCFMLIVVVTSTSLFACLIGLISSYMCAARPATSDARPRRRAHPSQMLRGSRGEGDAP